MCNPIGAFLHAGDRSILTDFTMTALKTIIPDWLYAGWSRIAEDPDMVIRGWDVCGLRSMFDGRCAEVVPDAKHATYDESHELHPLFPNGELGELPPEVAEGCTEPDMEPLFCEGNAAACEEQLAELDWKLPAAFSV
jgi:hypothetical protein